MFEFLMDMVNGWVSQELNKFLFDFCSCLLSCFTLGFSVALLIQNRKGNPFAPAWFAWVLFVLSLGVLGYIVWSAWSLAQEVSSYMQVFNG